MSDSYVERINTSFNTILKYDKPAPYTRFEGGHNVKTSPFVSGYWYFLIEPPTNNKLFSDSNRKSIIEVLHGAAESFTPPTRTINKGELSGFGGVKKYIVLNQTISSSFTINFLEFSKMPIRKALKMWTAINNPNYGFNVTDIYKGRAFVLLCKPTWSMLSSTAYVHGSDIPFTKDDIEELFYFEGVFPESDGSDSLQTDISMNDKVSYSIPFSFDSHNFGLENSDIVTDCISKFRECIGSYKQEMYNPFV